MMNREVTISLSELVPQAISRTRGREAFKALQKKATDADARRVYLLMTMHPPATITSSFIDQLVLDAAEAEKNSNIEVVFVITRNLFSMLQKSVTWRRKLAHYASPDDLIVKTLKPSKLGYKPLRIRSGEKPSVR